MNDLLEIFGTLIQEGEQLLPHGTNRFEGYNHKMQPQYVAWRLQCLEALSSAGSPSKPALLDIEKDEASPFFYASSVSNLLGALKGIYTILKNRNSKTRSDLKNSSRLVINSSRPSLNEQQFELLRTLVKSQQSIPDGQYNDFLTSSTFDGVDILLPTNESLPLNRQNLDELIDQNLVRITKTRKYGDINGHVTNQGLSAVTSNSSKNYEYLSETGSFDAPKDIPTVFISYTHESESHKNWVRVDLAERLMAAGVRVILDQWHLKLGSSLPHFMENLSSADAVLLVCTPQFAQKANSRQGGVGYESSIVTAELLEQRPSVEPKFVPLWRSGERTLATPNYIKAALGLDLRAENPNYESEFIRLLRQLHKEPEYTPPPLGKKPNFSSRQADKPEFVNE